MWLLYAPANPKGIPNSLTYEISPFGVRATISPLN